MKFICTAILLMLIAITTVPSVGFSEDLTPEKKAAIEKLMEVTGSKKIGLQMGNAITQNMANALKASNPDMPDRAFQILAEETNAFIAEDIYSLFSSIIPIYHTYFSKKEIEELLAFYETDIGKKTISVLPKVMNDSMVIGQTWGQNLLPKLVAKIEKRFLEEGVVLPE